MAKDPAFLFYSQDFFVGTATMSFEDKGKYIHLLCMMHQQGRMTEETIRLLVGSLSVILRAKFSIDEKGLWYNQRLEDETAKRNAFTESRRNNGILGGRPQKTKPKGKPTDNHMDNHMANHMGNENVIDNDIENRKAKFLTELSLFRNQYSDEMLKEFYEYWAEHNPNSKKFRKEFEKVFDIDRRLKTWSRNQSKFKTNNNGTKGKRDDLEETIRDFYAKNPVK